MQTIYPLNSTAISTASLERGLPQSMLINDNYNMPHPSSQHCIT